MSSCVFVRVCWFACGRTLVRACVFCFVFVLAPGSRLCLNEAQPMSISEVHERLKAVLAKREKIKSEYEAEMASAAPAPEVLQRTRKTT